MVTMYLSHEIINGNYGNHESHEIINGIYGLW